MALSFSFLFSIAFSIASSTVGPTQNDHILIQVNSAFHCKCSSTIKVLNSFNSYQLSVTETLFMSTIFSKCCNSVNTMANTTTDCVNTICGLWQPGYVGSSNMHIRLFHTTEAAHLWLWNQLKQYFCSPCNRPWSDQRGNRGIAILCL